MNFDFEHSKVFTLFNLIYPLSEELSHSIQKNSEVISIPKKSHLLHVNETCKAIYFIIKGSIRVYHTDQDGQETTSWLLFDDELAISVFSFFAQKPSFEAMETLEDSILLKLNFTKLSQLYQEHPEFNFIGRILTEQYYIRSEERAHILRTLSAKERYQHLLKTQPEIIKRVPLGYISSYLGVTQSTLSRIRAQV